MEMDPRLEVMASILGMREGGSQYSSSIAGMQVHGLNKGIQGKMGGGSCSSKG